MDPFYVSSFSCQEISKRGSMNLKFVLRPSWNVSKLAISLLGLELIQVVYQFSVDFYRRLPAPTGQSSHGMHTLWVWKLDGPASFACFPLFFFLRACQWQYFFWKLGLPWVNPLYKVSNLEKIFFGISLWIRNRCSSAQATPLGMIWPPQTV